MQEYANASTEYAKWDANVQMLSVFARDTKQAYESYPELLACLFKHDADADAEMLKGYVKYLGIAELNYNLLLVRAKSHNVSRENMALIDFKLGAFNKSLVDFKPQNLHELREMYAKTRLYLNISRVYVKLPHNHLPPDSSKLQNSIRNSYKKVMRKARKLKSMFQTWQF